MSDQLVACLEVGILDSVMAAVSCGSKNPL